MAHWTSLWSLLISTALIPSSSMNNNYQRRPTIVTTWSARCFQKATELAWLTYKRSGSRMQAVVEGCSYCEDVQCDGSIGFGGSPDEKNRVTLDAMLIDGPKHRIGGVAQLSKIKNAIQVAWAVMNFTKHTLLVGDQADNFAVEMGFEESKLETPGSEKIHRNWLESNCQPNFRQNVIPNPMQRCGPYKPFTALESVDQVSSLTSGHDTVGMLIVDENGDLSAGTSTNGASHKIPGRVSDSALTGAGAYVDNEVGSAAATGDGDVMQRFVPSFHTVMNMRLGMQPNEAAQTSIRQIAKYYPKFKGAIIALSKDGSHGSSCHGLGNFTYCVFNDLVDKVQLFTVNCV